jgi:hypothetical protein
LPLTHSAQQEVDVMMIIPVPVRLTGTARWTLALMNRRRRHDKFSY